MHAINPNQASLSREQARTDDEYQERILQLGKRINDFALALHKHSCTAELAAQQLQAASAYIKRHH